MILKIFSVYDVKAEAYLPPFYVASKGAAVRSFSDAASDPTHNFCKHAEDFTLFELGEFNDETGRIVTLDAFIPLGTALEHMRTADVGAHAPSVMRVK